MAALTPVIASLKRPLSSLLSSTASTASLSAPRPQLSPWLCTSCAHRRLTTTRYLQQHSQTHLRRTTTTTNFPPSPNPPQRHPRHLRHHPFTTKSPDRAVLQNPRSDETGAPMTIGITARAASRLKQIMEKDKNPDLALRVSVESGGCHGFQYLMSLTDMSKVDKEDDTVFEEDDGARVVLDEPSLELLKGSKVDYTMELIGSQFKIVDNPAASSSCGCGTSFDIKG